MKAYGVDKKDADCCPGHSKYGIYGQKGWEVPRKKNNDRPRKKTARRNAKMECYL